MGIFSIIYTLKSLQRLGKLHHKLLETVMSTNFTNHGAKHSCYADITECSSWVECQVRVETSFSLNFKLKLSIIAFLTLCCDFIMFSKFIAINPQSKLQAMSLMVYNQFQILCVLGFSFIFKVLDFKHYKSIHRGTTYSVKSPLPQK